ncbi:hypothetical protein [Pseudomonas sp.]|uniref:hypothetical protein n=1 Tax=Pseudomonas sp. TaxID=306 RepID=UPI003C739662
MNLVEILNTGTGGLAFLILMLAYRSGSKAREEIIKTDASKFPTLEHYREWSIIMKSLAIEARIYLFVSLAFFVVSVTIFIYQHSAKSKIYISVSPTESMAEPIIFHQGSKISLKEGQAFIEISSDHTLAINYEKIQEKYIEMKGEQDNLRKTNAALNGKLAELLPDAGLDI